MFKKNKYVCLNEIIWLMTIIMRLKMRNRSHRYDINRPRPRHEHKYTIYKMCLSIMMTIFEALWKSKATLRLSWKKALLIKKACISVFVEKKWNTYVLSLAVKKAKDSSQKYFSCRNINFTEGNWISYHDLNFFPRNFECKITFCQLIV